MSSWNTPQDPQFLQPQCRRVINDANCTPWEKLEWELSEPTEAGLRAWMSTPEAIKEGWKVEELHHTAWDDRIVDYGQRLQFYVLLPRDYEAQLKIVKEREKARPNRGDMVVCTNAAGLQELTEGKEYAVEGLREGLVLIRDDNGNLTEYFLDRFSYDVRLFLLYS
jgi:hypothetical protein